MDLFTQALQTAEPASRLSEEQLEAFKTRQKREIRVECNMEEFPYFRLSKRDSKTVNKITFAREVKNDRGGALKQRWLVVADSELGLPGPFDQDVYVAMETIIDEVGIHPDGFVPFTCYRIAQLLGKDHSGRTYQNIRTALTRMVATRITSEKAFYLRGENVHISETFHLYDSVRFEERKNVKRSKASFEYNLLFPCRWYIESRRQNYTKPLNLNIYKNLKSPTAKKLYRYLDKRRYANPERVAIHLFNLADALPLTPAFPSKLKQVLEEPHRQLLRIGFLRDVRFEQVPDTKSWRIFYTFPDEMPEVGECLPENPKVQLLLGRGLSPNVAEFLAQQYPERVQRQVEVFDWLVANKSAQVKHNPPGYLRKAIEDDYVPPPDFIPEAERQAAIEKGKEANARERERREAETEQAQQLKAQIEQVKANLSDHELQQLRKEAEENMNRFMQERMFREMNELGVLGPSTSAALEYELDRVIERRYLNLPDPE